MKPMELTTNQKISGRILTLIASGMSVREAMDAVLGEGTHARLAGEVYETLRARSEKK